MLQLLFRARCKFISSTDTRFLSRVSKFCSNCTAANDDYVESIDHDSGVYPNSPSHWHERSHIVCNGINVVDSDTWRVSTGLADLSKKSLGDCGKTGSFYVVDGGDGMVDGLVPVGETDQCFDDIDDMRARGDLFYKIDRRSVEFEECKFDFHRRNRSSSRPKHEENSRRKMENSSCHPSAKIHQDQMIERPKDSFRVSAREDGISRSIPFLDGEERLRTILREKYIFSTSRKDAEQKKRRKPTFNQLTGPYHEPFCLDILVSKGSVRACIVHRVTSKVVAVAHSISKDMKFDLGSPRSVAACAAVGKVLAQRALADDIHDVIFTPRKGDRLEGKLMIVLKSIRDNGVSVKLKLKQRNNKKVLSVK